MNSKRVASHASLSRSMVDGRAFTTEMELGSNPPGGTMDMNTKHGMAFGFRLRHYFACWCKQCRPRRGQGDERRRLHKLDRRNAKRDIRKELRDV